MFLSAFLHSRKFNKIAPKYRYFSDQTDFNHYPFSNKKGENSKSSSFTRINEPKSIAFII